MPIDKRRLTDWNLNTIIHVVTLITFAAGGVALWVNRSRDVDDLKEWRPEITQEIKELSTRVGTVEGLASSLGFRIQANEQQAAATASAIKDLQTTLNQQSGDIRVVREILQRIEAGQRRGPN